QTFEDLDVLAVLCQCYDSFLCLGCFANRISAAFFLAVQIHGVDTFYFCSLEHFLNSLFYHCLVGFRMNQEGIFLLAHGVHALLSYNRFKDYIIILNVSHYAYTSSMLATAALSRTTVLYFRISNTFRVLTEAVITLGMFFAETITFSL